MNYYKRIELEAELNERLKDFPLIGSIYPTHDLHQDIKLILDILKELLEISLIV